MKNISFSRLKRRFKLPYLVWKSEPHDRFGIATIKHIFGIAYSHWFFFGVVINDKEPKQ